MSVNLFSDVMSVYYGRKYFGEEAKTDVTGMIDKIKNVYRGRLQQNDWLTEGTRNKAIEKLDKMKVFVGYQEDVDPGTKELHLDPNKSFFELSEDIAQFGKRYTIDHFDDPIDKNKWSGSAFDINAYYNPESNSINFPAGILQAPFYDKNQSTEKNYGGIGVVIGHEITMPLTPMVPTMMRMATCITGGQKQILKLLTRESKLLKTSGMVWKFTGLR